MVGDYFVKYKSAPTTYCPLCIRTLAMLHCTAKDKIREGNFIDVFEGGGGGVGNSLKFTPGICGIPRAKFVCFQATQKELHKQTITKFLRNAENAFINFGSLGTPVKFLCFVDIFFNG